jgi:hypothetical protein
MLRLHNTVSELYDSKSFMNKRLYRFRRLRALVTDTFIRPVFKNRLPVGGSGIACTCKRD